MARSPGRRRYGTLGLPPPSRDQQRLSWLDRDLRQRRRELLRRQWKVLLQPVAAFAVAAAGPAVAVREHPLLLGGVMGCFLGAMVVGGAVWLNLLDGTLMARVGRTFERDVGRELRETAGIYGVVSDVSFDSCNVDHVVLCPRGVLAVEVKGLLGRRQTLGGLHGRADKLAQARGGARKVQSLLRAGGLGEVTVTPVLVLAGPGVPTLTGDEYEEGVRVLAFRDSDAWRPLLAATDRPALLDKVTARRAATVLLEHTRQRADHDRGRAAVDRIGHAVPRQLRRRPARISVASS